MLEKPTDRNNMRRSHGPGLVMHSCCKCCYVMLVNALSLQKLCLVYVDPENKQNTTNTILKNVQAKTMSKYIPKSIDERIPQTLQYQTSLRRTLHSRAQCPPQLRTAHQFATSASTLYTAGRRHEGSRWPVAEMLTLLKHKKQTAAAAKHLMQRKTRNIMFYCCLCFPNDLAD